MFLLLPHLIIHNSIAVSKALNCTAVYFGYRLAFLFSMLSRQQTYLVKLILNTKKLPYSIFVSENLLTKMPFLLTFMNS